MKFIISSRARRDLEEIGEWIARHDPDAAARFLGELEAKAREITSIPLAFPLVPRLAHLGVRKRSVRGYLILYRFSQSTVRVVRVVSGRRNYVKLFI